MLSVLICSHNGGGYLRSALESIFKCGLNEFEVVIVDDCSSDGSFKFLDEIDTGDVDVKVIRNEHKLGLAKSLNIAFAESRFEVLARMDSDDISEPGRLKAQLEYLQCHPEIDILGSNALLINSESRVIGKSSVPLVHDDIVKALGFRNPMIHPSVVMRRRVLERLSGYDETLPKAQDLDLWHRAANAGFKFMNLPECLIRYRVDLNKPLSTIFRGFRVSLGYAIRNRSFRGVIFSVLDLGKYVLIRGGLYTPRSMRQKR